MLRRYQTFLDRMQEAASRADSEAWHRYAAAQHIDCWSRVRVREKGKRRGWGKGRHGPLCYENCPKRLHGSTEKNESWKLELEKGDFIAGIEHDEAEARRLLFPEQYRTMPRRRDFEFAELQYFCSDQCQGPNVCKKPMFFHKRRDPNTRVVECPILLSGPTHIEIKCPAQ